MSTPQIDIRRASALLKLHFEQGSYSPTPPMSRAVSPIPFDIKPYSPAGEAAGSGQLAQSFIQQDRLRRSCLFVPTTPLINEDEVDSVAEEVEYTPLTPTEEEENEVSRNKAELLALERLADLKQNNRLTFEEIGRLTATYFSGECKGRDISRWKAINGFTRDEACARVAAERPLKYYDIVPWDHTLAASGDDFVNANLVTVAGKTYIASEGPRPEDFNNFWRLIAERSNVIVMLTELLEARRIKAHCYWPSTIGEEFSFSGSQAGSSCPEAIKVKLLSEEVISPDADFDQSSYDKAGRQYMIKYTFTLLKGEEEKTVILLRYRHLKDMDAPGQSESACFLRLLEEIDQAEAEFPGNTTTVHCSAGVGRAGLVLGCRFLKAINDSGMLSDDVPAAAAELLVKMRAQRDHLIQTEKQYNQLLWYGNSLRNKS